MQNTTVEISDFLIPFKKINLIIKYYSLNFYSSAHGGMVMRYFPIVCRQRGVREASRPEQAKCKRATMNVRQASSTNISLLDPAKERAKTQKRSQEYLS